MKNKGLPVLEPRISSSGIRWRVKFDGLPEES